MCIFVCLFIRVEAVPSCLLEFQAPVAVALNTTRHATSRAPQARSHLRGQSTLIDYHGFTYFFLRSRLKLQTRNASLAITYTLSHSGLSFLFFLTTRRVRDCNTFQVLTRGLLLTRGSDGDGCVMMHASLVMRCRQNFGTRPARVSTAAA
jgi:hypothetical protein